RAAVSFGNYEHIQQAKKRKKGKSVSASSLSQPKAEALPTEMSPTKGESAPAQVPPQSKIGTTKKKAPQNQSTPLWDLTMIEDPTPPARIASSSLSSEPPEQLTLF
ncbi:MAG TPA: hypothetical protein VII61_00910, partial [Ktedonobacteraceae bacterium]